jgi:L-glutamine-phosphate cytidylyltransferase
LALTAIILAAGRGSRLHPYTESCPKCLTELGDTTLLDRQLATLRECGVQDIVIATGYLADMLERPGIVCVNNPLWAETNMVESLFCAEGEFTDDIIVSYSDIVYQPRILQALLDSSSDISVVVDRRWRALWERRFDDPLSDAETLRLDDRGDIVEIGQPPTSFDQIEAQYIGLMRFRGDGVTALRDGYASMGEAGRPWKKKRPAERAYMTDLLSELILLGHRVHSVQVDAGWLEVDTVHDHKLYASMFGDGSITEFFDPADSTR